MSFRAAGGPGINRTRSIQLSFGSKGVVYFLASDPRALTTSNFARRPVEFGYSRYLFHDPSALGAFTLP
jgi:hypothetical protein